MVTPAVPLFVPGDRPDRFAKAAASGADAVILDLEDAVAPANKDGARRSVAAHGLTGIPVIVRVNASGTPWLAADIASLAGTDVAAIMLPKAEAAAEITAIRQVLALPVIPLIESARGIGNLAQLLAASGVAVAAIGNLDLALDLGCEPSWDALLLARGTLVLQSRLAGLPAPLDGVTAATDDAPLIEAETRRAAALGFGGKLAIHPRQIAPIRRGLQPAAAQVAWAERVLAAEAGGVTSVDGAMVDRPVLERARRIMGLGHGLPRPAAEDTPPSSVRPRTGPETA
jgi:citrate lyase subunit beta/citryl-CoA lyase